MILLGGFPGGLDGKESPWYAEDLGSIPGLGRSPGEGSFFYRFQFFAKIFNLVDYFLDRID